MPEHLCPLPAPPKAHPCGSPRDRLPSLPLGVIHFLLLQSHHLRTLSPFSRLETLQEQPPNFTPRLLPATTAFLFPIRVQVLQGAASIVSTSLLHSLSNVLPAGSAQSSLQQNQTGRSTVLHLHLVWPTDQLTWLHAPPSRSPPTSLLGLLLSLVNLHPWKTAVPHGSMVTSINRHPLGDFVLSPALHTTYMLTTSSLSL